MAVRVVYWNINNFSLKKIFRGARAAQARRLQAADRLSHIVGEVVTPHAPHLFIVVEVYDRTQDVSLEGVILRSDSKSGQGVRRLLGSLRGALGDTWCLVPPVQLGGLGFKECVAVFYDAAELEFTGPYVFANPPQGVAGAFPATPASLAVIANYSANWKDGLPSPNNQAANLQLNRSWVAGGVQVPEFKSAGQWEFKIPVQGQVGIYTRLNWPGQLNRGPFYTRFREVANPNRILKVFTVHNSPLTASQMVPELAKMTELPAGNNEVSLVLGDFNVDSFGLSGPAYNALRVTHTQLLEPRDPNTGNIDATRKRFLMTHLLPATETNQITRVTRQVATPFNATGWAAGPDPQHNVYPRYGYMGSIVAGVINDTGAIDNAFVQYGPGLPVPPHQTSIVNTVVGKPYQDPNVDPVLTGGLAWPHTLANAIPAGGANPPAANQPQVDTINFVNWVNFERIRNVSDHLALLIDV